jgi:hypothetical protein
MALVPLGLLSMIRSATPLVTVLVVLASAAGMCSGVLADEHPADAAEPIAVYVDIRPGICPNHVRLESPLPIAVAVLGTMDFEVAGVEAGSIRLSRDDVAEEVEPLSYAYRDVGMALIGGRCACHELRGDGLDDIEFYFSIAELGASLGLEGHIGETIPLTLSGKLMTGEDIEGVDCAVVIGGPWGNEETGGEIGLLARLEEESAADGFRFAYYTAVSDRVTFAIYDIRGRVVAKLIDMDMAPGIYQAIWDGTSPDSLQVPAGTYFARVSNSWTSDTRKITVPQ